MAAGVVAEQDGRTVVYGDQDIDRAIVVEIAEGQAACGELAGEDGPLSCADIFQARGRVLEKKERLAVGYAGIDLVDEIVGMAVGDEEVEEAVVIEVEKFGAPAAHHLRGACDAGGAGFVFEGFVALVLVEAVELVVEICDE